MRSRRKGKHETIICIGLYLASSSHSEKKQNNIYLFNHFFRSIINSSLGHFFPRKCLLLMTRKVRSTQTSKPEKGHFSVLQAFHFPALFLFAFEVFVTMDYVICHCLLL